ncbi:MAG TPA: hypothetical protein VGI55_19285 [Solirubrobacteraceae bacterium]
MRVTVVPGPRGHAIRDRGAKIRAALGLPVIIGVIVLVVVTGAILVASSLAGGGAVRALARPSAPGDPPGDDPRDAVEDATGDAAGGVARNAAGMAGVAAAYRYPLGCLGITLSAERSSMVGRHSPCWHYDVYVTAVLHKTSGEWRLMLETTSPTCPAVTLPAVVRSALAACRRAAAPGLRDIP